jgi:hypothetical protein
LKFLGRDGDELVGEDQGGVGDSLLGSVGGH